MQVVGQGMPDSIAERAVEAAREEAAVWAARLQAMRLSDQPRLVAGGLLSEDTSG